MNQPPILKGYMSNGQRDRQKAHTSYIEWPGYTK